VPRIGQLGWVNIELGVDMRGESVMGGELKRDLFSGLVGQPLGLINTGEFAQLTVRVLGEFGTFLGQPGPFGVALAGAADMIVIGNHGTGGALIRLLGSVSQKVARHAGVPVIGVHDHDHLPMHG